jgi:hypothetical protein
VFGGFCLLLFFAASLAPRVGGVVFFVGFSELMFSGLF